MSIVVTMFISSVVTFKSLDDLNLFWEICCPVLIVKNNEKKKSKDKSKRIFIFLFFNKKILDPINKAIDDCLKYILVNVTNTFIK